MGDPNSLSCKVVTLPTSQPPMGWLKALAFKNAAWGRDVIRTHAGSTDKKRRKKEGKYMKKKQEKKGRKRRRKRRRKK